MKQIIILALIVFSLFEAKPSTTTQKPSATPLTLSLNRARTSDMLAVAAPPKKKAGKSPAPKGGKAAPAKKQPAAKKPATSKEAKTRQSATQKDIRKKEQQLKENMDSVKRNMRRLDVLKSQISDCTLEINALDSMIKALDDSTAVAEANIAALEKRLEAMRQAYRQSLLSMRRSRRQMSDISFVFSANSFRQALRRSTALRNFSKWRSRRAEDIKLTRTELEEQRDELLRLRNECDSARSTVVVRRDELADNEKKARQLDDKLKRNQNALKSAISEQQRQMEDLDREIARLVEQERKAAEAERRKAEEAKRKAEEEAKRKAEEQRKAKEQAQKSKDKSKNPPKEQPQAQPSAPKQPTPPPPAKPSGKTVTPDGTAKEIATVGADFAQNKGHLRYPVDGRYSISKHFGVNPHPNSPSTQFDSHGIELITNPGAQVKCVFNGKVSAVIPTRTNNTVVFVRHGTYMTVYANLKSASVKKGQEVSKDQTLGTVASAGEHGILVFEIRNLSGTSSGGIKENPELWLKR